MTRSRQHGVTLVIALIVLVAMTLAGLAMMRSVDTGTLVAGNIAFRQASINAADSGLQAGYSYLDARKATAALYNNDNLAGAGSNGYYASSPAAERDWTDSNTWTNAAAVNGGTPDAAGNVVYYVIERLCNLAGDPTGGGMECGKTPGNITTGGSQEGNDLTMPVPYSAPPALHYRVTSRSVGPRNSISIVQTLLRSQ